jgi:hypothetical protein
MYKSESQLNEVLSLLENKFGAISERCGSINFSTLTNYYDSEMSGDVNKEYIVFEKPINRSTLSEIKLFTNSLEEKFLGKLGREINLDPGYITSEKFVLASVKDFAHRIHIGDGIFAEVTLHFKKGKTQFFSWTYSDYMEKEVELFLLVAQKRAVKLKREIN